MEEELRKDAAKTRKDAENAMKQVRATAASRKKDADKG